jgi:hypothetical protein
VRRVGVFVPTIQGGEPDRLKTDPAKADTRATMIIRMRFKVLGGHVHLRVFTAPAKNMTFAKCGDLTVRLDEWDRWRDMLHSAVEFLPEDALEQRAETDAAESISLRTRLQELVGAWDSDAFEQFQDALQKAKAALRAATGQSALDWSDKREKSE